ncbi:MAG TPA: long-chain fatty acid--CoA ligase [Bacteroidetes bacterium]|nr:long-chain fatty acid--CoA ligase [Bacteroidota bacterium]
MLKTGIVDKLYHSAQEFPDRTAFVYENSPVSYSELLDRVEQYAAAIDALGLTRGKRVALMLPNIPEFVYLYYALLRQGLEVIPLNIMLKAGEIRYILEDSESASIIAWDRFSTQVTAAVDGLDSCKYQLYIGTEAPGSGLNLTEFGAQRRSVPPACELEGEDPAVIFYTAGTTGNPKGAVLSHAGIASTVQGISETFFFTHTDRVFAVLPLFHALGQMLTMNVPIATGAAFALHPRFDRETIEQFFQNDAITVIVGVPALFEAIQSRPEIKEYLSDLRLCISSGAPLPQEIQTGFIEVFGIAILQGYGLSECSPLVTCNRIYREQRAGTVGLPVPENEVAIFDDDGRQRPTGEVGEIGIRSPSVMKYYLNRPQATRSVIRDGWLMTGDVGKIDTDGYLHLVDRKKDIILKCGFHVYPREVERVLLAHQKVAQAAVVGVKSPRIGEDVKAFVVLKQGEQCSSAELIDYCNEKMAAYKCPGIIEFVSELPLGSTGKVLKKDLK